MFYFQFNNWFSLYSYFNTFRSFQAVLVKNSQATIYVSGQLGINPGNGTLVPGGIESEFEQIMKNVTSILKEASADLR